MGVQRLTQCEGELTSVAGQHAGRARGQQGVGHGIGWGVLRQDLVAQVALPPPRSAVFFHGVPFGGGFSSSPAGRLRQLQKLPEDLAQLVTRSMQQAT